MGNDCFTKSTGISAGPLSYLFHSVHEQTHVAHVAAFAMCAGPNYRESSNCNSEKWRSPRTLFANSTVGSANLCKVVQLVALAALFLGR